MSNNPVLNTVIEILADAQRLMGSAVSLAWDLTRLQENYVSRWHSWQGFDAPMNDSFDMNSRLKLIELSPALSHGFQLALKNRMQVSLGMLSSDLYF